jgi:hypothetical protein
VFLLVYWWPATKYFGGHSAYIIFNKCVEFYQPEIYLNINIKETYYYEFYTREQLPYYNSISFGSSSLPFSKFISEHHWSSKSRISTPEMGMYFSKILFKSIGEASKNAFFFEVLYTTFSEIEGWLEWYFTHYYNWQGRKFIADYMNVDLGGLRPGYSFKFILNQIKNKTSILMIRDEHLKIFFFDKPIIYVAPPQFWTCYTNKQFSFDNINHFDLTYTGINFYRQKN